MAKFNRDKFIRVLKNRINEQDAYAPLETGKCRLESWSLDKLDKTLLRPDFEISFTWRSREFRFVAEIKTRTSPREVRDYLRDLKERWNAQASRADSALLALPHISSSIAELLEETGLSGLDLNGNYILQTEDFIAIRLDQENKYKESGGIKNVFRGTSSIICRYLLHKPGPHETVSAIHRGIRELDGRASLSTVSKVLSALDAQLIIEKGDYIRVLQPEKLLRSLRNEYRPPRSAESVSLNLPDDRHEKEAVLTDLLGGALWVWGGETSAERYATTTPAQEDVAYTRELPVENNQLSEFQNKRFYNCILRESREDFVYFGHAGHWAADIQTYLDLMQGDKREREVALQIEKRILNRFYSETEDEYI